MTALGEETQGFEDVGLIVGDEDAASIVHRAGSIGD